MQQASQTQVRFSNRERESDKRESPASSVLLNSVGSWNFYNLYKFVMNYNTGLQRVLISILGPMVAPY